MLFRSAPFRDRVVHHALCNLIEPIFEKSFIFDSYANRLGKGTHKALDRATHYACKFRYVLTCDIRQFFPSIDHEILLDVIARSVRCDETISNPAEGEYLSSNRGLLPEGRNDILWLIKKILQSGVEVLSEEYQMAYFPSDDLFAISRARGLPIGNLTSQFWANC